MRENHRLITELRSLDHETKKQMRLCERLKKEHSDLRKTVNCQKSEIQTLQTHVRVETLKTASHTKKRSRSGTTSDGDIMRVGPVRASSVRSCIFGWCAGTAEVEGRSG